MKKERRKEEKRKKAALIKTPGTPQVGFCDATRGSKLSEDKYVLIQRNHPETRNTIQTKYTREKLLPNITLWRAGCGEMYDEILLPHSRTTFKKSLRITSQSNTLHISLVNIKCPLSFCFLLFASALRTLRVGNLRKELSP